MRDFNRLAFACLLLAASTTLTAVASPAATRSGVRPVVTFVSAPANGDSVIYHQMFSWSGTDADGSVVGYRWVVDPGPDTFWVSTPNTSGLFFFQSRVASMPPSGPVVCREWHTFVVEALDDEGLQSVPAERSFTTYTLAPVVSITTPTPSAFVARPVGPAPSIVWEGTDPDGVFIQHPVKYRYLLLAAAGGPFDFFTAASDPDSLRRWAVANHWAGWDSTSGDTTWVQYRNLTPNQFYLFVVTGMDEAGGYDPVFSLSKNMLQIVIDQNLGADGGVEPGGLALAEPAPNPAVGRATMAFTLPRPADVSLAIHDLAGRRVRVLDAGWRDAGPHRYTWDLKDDAGARVRPAMYLVRLAAGGESRTRKMLVSR